MDMYLLTAFFVVYALAVILCWQVGFPKAAKLGFLLIAIGLIVMSGANAFALNALTTLWRVPRDSPEGLTQDVERALSGTSTALLISKSAFTTIVVGVVLSFFGSVQRVIARRKQVFRFRSTDSSV